MAEVKDPVGWRRRLRALMKARGTNMRQLSLKIKPDNEHYVKSIITKPHEPSITNLANICNALGVPLSAVVADPEEEAKNVHLAHSIAQLPAKERRAVEALIASFMETPDNRGDDISVPSAETPEKNN